MSRVVWAIALGVGVLAPEVASACGGFFCQQDPMDQSGEEIVFAVDEGAGKVTAHIQINYTGSAMDFAWVVPVATVPELFVSTEQLFDELRWRTDPTFFPIYEEEGDCSGYQYGGYYSDVASASSSATLDSGGAGTVVVVAQQDVGPYETVTLQAQSSEGLVAWLQDNGYDLPSGLDPVLAPYVADGAYFVALRLQNDKDTGDLVPLGMTYDGTKASIPIQLTSIAATPDMRLRAWVFSDARVVPESYLHVHVNEIALDWTQYGDNYEEVITRAADEAGGHAFATDMAGSTDPLVGSLWWDGRYNVDALAAATSPVAFMDQLIGQGFPANTTLLNLLLAYMPPPAGVEATDFYNCVECYPEHVATLDFDSVAFAAAIDEVIVQPLIAAEGLFGTHTWVSRMTSSVSPAEMTVDPVFVTNPDMGTVEAAREAKLVWLCNEGQEYYDAERRLELADGRTLIVPSDAWLAEHELTYEDFVENATEHDAVIIEATGASGQPEVIADYSDEDLGDFDGSDPSAVAADDRGGCGCANAGGGAGWMLALFGLVATRRRR